MPFSSTTLPSKESGGSRCRSGSWLDFVGDHQATRTEGELPEAMEADDDGGPIKAPLGLMGLNYNLKLCLPHLERSKALSESLDLHLSLVNSSIMWRG